MRVSWEFHFCVRERARERDCSVSVCELERARECGCIRACSCACGCSLSSKAPSRRLSGSSVPQLIPATGRLSFCICDRIIFVNFVGEGPFVGGTG